MTDMSSYQDREAHQRRAPDTADRTTDWLAEYLQAAVNLNPNLQPFVPHLRERHRLEAVAGCFTQRRFEADQTMLSQGTPARDLLLVVEGRGVVLLRPRSDAGSVGDPQRVGRMEAPDVAGEMGLVLGGRRTATVLAATEVRALELKDVGLVRCIETEPLLAVGLLRWFAQNAGDKLLRTRWFSDGYPVGTPLDQDGGPESGVVNPPDAGWQGATEGLLDEIVGRLRALRCFHWEPSQIHRNAAARFRLRGIAAGDDILREGDPGNSLLLLSRGSAHMLDRDRQPLESFVAGHRDSRHVLMGERSFLLPGPRVGSITATEDCELLEISWNAVPRLVGAAPWLAAALHVEVLRVVCRRLLQTSSASAQYQAVLGGDWEQWFVRDDYYLGRQLTARTTAGG
jgi:CRP-like cAMP-binding protein